MPSIATAETVSGPAAGIGRQDDARADRHLHRFQDIASSQVDGRGAGKDQWNIGFVRRDQRIDYPADVTARQIVRFQLVCVESQSRFGGVDERVDDDMGGHAAQTHPDQREETHRNAGCDRRDPEPDRDEVEEHREGDDECEEQNDYK